MKIAFTYELKQSYIDIRLSQPSFPDYLALTTSIESFTFVIQVSSVLSVVFDTDGFKKKLGHQAFLFKMLASKILS